MFLEKKTLSTTSNVLGISMMCVHAISISFLYIIIKLLSVNIHSNQISFLYKLIILIIITISSVKKGIIRNLKTKKIKLHILRGIFSIFGSLSMFYALTTLQTTNVIALSKLEHSFMVILGIIIFKEQVTQSKIILLLGNIVGTCFVFDFIKIGKNFSKDYLYIILALLFWSINNLIIKQLAKTETSKTQLFYSSLFATIISFFFSIPYWKSISIKNFYLIIFAAFASLTHKLFFFKAYKMTDISIVSSFDYLKLVVTGLLAFLFLNEIPTYRSLLGYFIIIITGIYFILFEIKKNTAFK